MELELYGGKSIALRLAERNTVEKTIDAEAVKIFLMSLPLILANSDVILSDSRMFLSAVPLKSGLAYSGPLGGMCLGGLIEWWLYGKGANTNDGFTCLVLNISGSQLSGNNRCTVYNANGTVTQKRLVHFHSLLYSYLEFKNRYSSAMDKYAYLPIVEVIQKLSEKGDAEDEVSRKANLFLQRAREGLR